jgi:hypothetical protein
MMNTEETIEFRDSDTAESKPHIRTIHTLAITPLLIRMIYSSYIICTTAKDYSSRKKKCIRLESIENRPRYHMEVKLECHLAINLATHSISEKFANRTDES